MKKENLFLNLLIRNINIKYFYILKSKTFIISFFIIFCLGAVFTYKEMQRCYVQGNFQFNPIYTPPKILQNEFFFIKNISKKFPSIKWNKNQFEISGPSKGKNNFCLDQITKFTDEIDQEYKVILRNLVPTMSRNDLNVFLDVLVENNITSVNQETLNQIDQFRALYIDEQIELLSQNPDKYMMDWKEINKMTFENLLKQLVVFSVYSLIFSLLITTIFDLVRLVGSKIK